MLRPKRNCRTNELLLSKHRDSLIGMENVRKILIYKKRPLHGAFGKGQLWGQKSTALRVKKRYFSGLKAVLPFLREYQCKENSQPNLTMPGPLSGQVPFFPNQIRDFWSTIKLDKRLRTAIINIFFPLNCWSIDFFFISLRSNQSKHPKRHGK